MKTVTRIAAALAIVGVSAAPAFAHPGHDWGLSAGLAHPLSGLDHLAAMLAVGLWAATRPATRAWQAPALFVTLLAAGAALGVIGGIFAPVEVMITGSVSVLGLLLLAAPFLPASAGLALIGICAVLHGYAHGAEATGSLAGYFAGFMIASAALHAVGWRLGVSLFATRWGRIVTGLTMGAAGLALAGL